MNKHLHAFRASNQREPRRLTLCIAAAALAASTCRAPEKPEERPAVKDEMKVEQTPVSSIYEEKGGVLYERPAARPTKATPPPAPTPSPRKP